MDADVGLKALARYLVAGTLPARDAGKLERSRSTGDERSHDALGDLFRDKVRCLSDILSSIEVEARSRRELSGELALEIQRQYCYLKTKLFELYGLGLGQNRALDQRRSRLETQLDKLNEESRLERVRAWQDVERLATEWRTWFKQYCDLVQRLRIVGFGKQDVQGEVQD